MQFDCRNENETPEGSMAKTDQQTTNPKNAAKQSTKRPRKDNSSQKPPKKLKRGVQNNSTETLKRAINNSSTITVLQRRAAKGKGPLIQPDDDYDIQQSQTQA